MDSQNQKERTSQEWVQELRGDRGLEEQGSAYQDLATILEKAVRNTLYKIEGAYQQDYQLEDLVSETVQETLQKIFEERLYDAYSGRARFTTYVHSIVSHHLISKMRRKKWEFEHQLESLPNEQDIEDGVSPLTLKYLIDPKCRDAEMQMELDEFWKDLQECIEDLSHNRKEVLLWYVEEELTIEELTKRLHKSRGAVYNLLFNARDALRSCLNDKGWTPADTHRYFNLQ